MGFFELFKYPIQFHILFLLILCYVCYYNWKRRHIYKTAWQLPGFFAYPIIGNAPFLIKSTEETILDDLLRITDTCGTPSKFWLGTTLCVIISKPRHLEALMKNQNAFDKHDIYKFMKPCLGDGLITLKTDLWKSHRKVISQTFNQNILNTFVVIFDQIATELNEKLDQYVGKGVFDMLDVVARSSTDLVSRTIMGGEMQFVEGKSGFHEWMIRACQIFFLRMMKVWLWPDFIFYKTSLGKELNELADKVNEYGRKAIKQKKEDYNEKKRRQSEPDICLTSLMKKRKIFLDYLIELSEEGDTHFTDEDLLSEVNTMFAAGTDTTAKTECFTLLALALHPEIQQQVYEEQVDIFHDEDREITNDDLNRMELLERVIKETMRVFPTVPLISRTIKGDVDIGDFVLAKGCAVTITIVVAHKDPEIWSDPWKFDPDRFLPENVAKLHPYAFILFSGGPRNCIGWKFAMMAAKTMLAKVIRKYKFFTEYKSVEEIKVSAGITLNINGGHKLFIERRV